MFPVKSPTPTTPKSIFPLLLIPLWQVLFFIFATMSTSCPATTGKVVLNSKDRSRIDFSSDYVEWGAYLVPESVCLLVISHSKCCRSGEITRGDICNGFIFCDHQHRTHRVIDNIAARRISNTDFFCFGGDTTELFSAVLTWCGRAPDLNGDRRCFCCCR